MLDKKKNQCHILREGGKLPLSNMQTVKSRLPYATASAQAYCIDPKYVERCLSKQCRPRSYCS